MTTSPLHPQPPAGSARHLGDLTAALAAFGPAAERAYGWGTKLCELLVNGQRLLAAGNGGSAAQAQHLTAELVGRYAAERRPFPAISLHAETSTLTALLNDYGPEAVFARQVHGHGRPGDVLVLLSTSGRSANLLAAARAAAEVGVTTWAFTGPAPNPLAARCDEAIAVPGRTGATVQELHLVAIHLLCQGLDAELPRWERDTVPMARTSAAALPDTVLG